MLSKGFLKGKYSLVLEKRKVIITLFIFLGYSFSLYCFTLYMREMFRYFTFMGDSDYLLVLNPSENFFYNFFFAFLATLTGISFGAEYLIKTQFQLPRYIRYTISNDAGGLLWYANYWIIKLGTFFAILGWSFSLTKEFDFYKDYWFLFPMILLVLFFNQWTRFRLYIKQNSFKIMFSFLIIVTAYASILAALPLFDYKSFNHAILSKTISFNYTINLPKADVSHPIQRWSMIEEVFMGIPKNKISDSVELTIREMPESFSKNDFKSWLTDQLDKFDIYDKDNFTIVFNCDKDIPMEKVKSILTILREQSVTRLRFATGDNRTGIGLRLLQICHEIKPDTASHWQPSCGEIANDLLDSKTISMHLTKNHISILGLLQTQNTFEKVLRDMIETRKSNYIISLRIDNDVSYQSYISLIDILYKTIYSLRAEFAKEQFSEIYDYNDTPFENQKLNDSLKLVYPFSLIMPSDEEWRYIDSLNKKENK